MLSSSQGFKILSFFFFFFHFGKIVVFSFLSVSSPSVGQVVTLLHRRRRNVPSEDRRRGRV